MRPSVLATAFALCIGSGIGSTRFPSRPRPGSPEGKRRPPYGQVIRRSSGGQSSFSGANTTGKEFEGSLTPLSNIVVTGYTFSVTMAESGVGDEAEWPFCSWLARQIGEPVLLDD